MAQVILLSDTVTNLLLGDSRYMGPYVLATQLKKAGFSVVVIDYFTRIPDFFTYLENFLDSSTLFVGLSSTFLSHSPDLVRFQSEEYRESLLKFQFLQKGNNREENKKKYSNTGLWLESRAHLGKWLLELRKKLSEHNPNSQIVLGGAKANLLIQETPAIEDFDYYALSASDIGLVDFATSLRDKEIPKYFLHNGYKVIDNREALNKKSCPETKLDPSYAIMSQEALPIEISRGCIFNCKYCHYDKKESFRKDLQILRNEFIRNFELFGTTVYHFCDDCFNDSRKKVVETCEMILGLPFKIEWISYARVDIGVRFPETMDLMVESGASGLFLGLESFNFEAAKNAGKRIPPDEVKDFLLKTYERHKHRCLFEASFIVGLPGETKESIYDTMNWLQNNNALDFINVAPLYLQPFEKNLDKVSMDYAEYSRNPEAYGIKTSVSNTAWSHSTMTSEEASDLTFEFLNSWTEHGHRTMLRNVFDYPILRTLGCSKDDIWEMARNEQVALQWGQDVMGRFEDFKYRYWKQLAAFL